MPQAAVQFLQKDLCVVMAAPPILILGERLQTVNCYLLT